MNGLSGNDVWLFLLSLGILLAVARVFGEIAQRFGQPSVLGEMLAGVLLGPTVLGALSPEWNQYLFPMAGPRGLMFDGLSTLAITLFLMVVGMDERSMLTAARHLVKIGGGWAVARGEKVLASLPLVLGGLMSDRTLAEVLTGLKEMEAASRKVCALADPFMPISFLALPVIPHLKISDRGLIDVDAFAPVGLFVD